MRKTLAIIAVLLPLAAGCASPLAGVRASIEEATAAYDREKVEAEESYRRAQLDCLARPPPELCIAKVRAAWKPTNDAFAAFYSTLVSARFAVKIASAGEALGRSPDLVGLLVLAGKAIDAGARFAAELGKVNRAAPEGAP